MEGKAIELEQRKEYLGNIDPFDLPLEVVKSLSSDEYRTVIQTLYWKTSWSILFYVREMKIGVTDSEKSRCLEKVVEGVEDWRDRRKNPYREGFVGRDILLTLQVQITLNSQLHESYWKLL